VEKLMHIELSRPSGTIEIDNHVLQKEDKVEVETRIKALEERQAESEREQHTNATVVQDIFKSLKTIEENSSTTVARVQALETNFSLINAALHHLIQRMETIEKDAKSILEFLRNPGTKPH
jgi:hypothetical protein